MEMRRSAMTRNYQTVVCDKMEALNDFKIQKRVCGEVKLDTTVRDNVKAPQLV